MSNENEPVTIEVNGPRPTCYLCGEQINDDHHFRYDGQPAHEECLVGVGIEIPDHLK